MNWRGKFRSRLTVFVLVSLCLNTVLPGLLFGENIIAEAATDKWVKTENAITHVDSNGKTHSWTRLQTLNLARHYNNPGGTTDLVRPDPVDIFTPTKESEKYPAGITEASSNKQPLALIFLRENSSFLKPVILGRNFSQDTTSDSTSIPYIYDNKKDRADLGKLYFSPDTTTPNALTAYIEAIDINTLINNSGIASPSGYAIQVNKLSFPIKPTVSNSNDLNTAIVSCEKDFGLDWADKTKLPLEMENVLLGQGVAPLSLADFNKMYTTYYKNSSNNHAHTFVNGASPSPSFEAFEQLQLDWSNQQALALTETGKKFAEYSAAIGVGALSLALFLGSAGLAGAGGKAATTAAGETGVKQAAQAAVSAETKALGAKLTVPENIVQAAQKGNTIWQIPEKTAPSGFKYVTGTAVSAEEKLVGKTITSEQIATLNTQAQATAQKVEKAAVAGEQKVVAATKAGKKIDYGAIAKDVFVAALGTEAGGRAAAAYVDAMRNGNLKEMQSIIQKETVALRLIGRHLMVHQCVVNTVKDKKSLTGDWTQDTLNKEIKSLDVLKRTTSNDTEQTGDAADTLSGASSGGLCQDNGPLQNSLNALKSPISAAVCDLVGFIAQGAAIFANFAINQFLVPALEINFKND